MKHRTGVISASVFKQLAELSGAEMKRLAGKDRYGTALAIAGEFERPLGIFVTTGKNWPDALSASSLSGSCHEPLLLAPPGVLGDEVRSFLRETGVKEVTFVGGKWPSAISSLKSMDKTIKTVTYSGKDRYATSVAVAAKTVRPSTVILASGTNFADSISGSPVAGVNGSPLILSKANCAPAIVANFISANANLYLSGGSAVISKASATKNCAIVNPPVYTNTGWLKEFRTYLNALGGSYVPLGELKGSCTGVVANGCAYSGGTRRIEISASMRYAPVAKRKFVVAHEFAHIKQFENWGKLVNSASYKRLFNSNPETLADCMANVKGFYWNGAGCSGERYNYARGAWNGKV